MTEHNARRVSNILLGVAGAVAAYFILKNPSSRRIAWRVLKVGLGTTVPGYLLKEAASAWEETGRRAA